MPSLRVLPLFCLLLSALAWSAPALAQVPQDTTFTGRLVDDLGVPLAGPVDLELRVFDAASLGSPLYSEAHLGTALDATGGFSVQLGLGTSPSGSFDAALFSDVNRWLEVVVDAEVLMPRQIIGSVPWALIAQQANEIVPDPNAPRFEDCGDGTVADRQTGLQWEKKTGTLASGVSCDTTSCPDPHDVNNLYQWSVSATAPDGGAFTDFLAKLNDPTFGEVVSGDIYASPAATGCFAAHCDWRLPIVDELGSILVGPDAAPGQAGTCSTAPCIDPDFAALAGPTASARYWSASTEGDSGGLVAWDAGFADGSLGDSGVKFLNDLSTRAVRQGSCH